MSYPQVDSVRWYPLDIGNYWEYYRIDANNPPDYKQYIFEEIIGDTLISNEEYKILKKSSYDGKYIFATRYKYYRESKNKIYEWLKQSLYGENCPNAEYLKFDFNNLSDTTIWPICTIDDTTFLARSFLRDQLHYVDAINKVLPAKLFENLVVESNDSLWNPMGGYPDLGVISISKGIGIDTRNIWEAGQFFLQGGIIANQTFGVITDIESDKNIVPEQLSISTFPNPFNNRVTLNIEIPTPGQTELTIYNILGEKVEIILNEYKHAGKHFLNYNAENLISGTYIVSLKQNGLITNKKIVLLK